MGKLVEALYRREEELSDKVWDAADSLEVLAEMLGYEATVGWSNTGAHFHLMKNSILEYTLNLYDKKVGLKSSSGSLENLVYNNSVGFEQSLLGCIERLVKKL